MTTGTQTADSPTAGRDYERRCPLAGDPKAELRQFLTDNLRARWLVEAHNGTVEDPPYDGQCEQIASWVADLFTVEEDFTPIEDYRLDNPTGTTIWHRRLVASTGWQPTTAPDPTS